MAERQVVFYECQDIAKRAPFDRLLAVEGINDLDDADWRVSDAADEQSDLGVIVDAKGTKTRATYLRFLRIRPDAPYKLSAARKLSPVEVAHDESITEFTWAALWPDGFMAGVSSRDAPGHKKLARYFMETSGQEVHIVNLFDPKVVERLKAIHKRLRSVQVKVRASEATQLEADERTKGFGQFWRAGKGVAAATIGVEVTMGRSQGPTLDESFGLSAVALAEHVDMLESMHVSGLDADGKTQTINLKHQRIGGTIEIGDSNASVYKAIEQGRKTAEKNFGPLNNAARGS